MEDNEFHHSHKKRKNTLETRAVLTEISIFIEIYRAAQNTEDHFNKNMALPEGNKLFLGDLRANVDEINTDMVQFTKRWTWKWIV